MLECGMLECWNVGMLECWNVGMLECWSVGVLECWNVGVLECWNEAGGGMRLLGAIPWSFSILLDIDYIHRRAG
jgi:hypothetical protein